MSDFTKSRISKSDDWRTPKEVYDALDAEFHFNDDPCPIQGNGGLEREWGTSVFLNPPYSKPTPWVKKAYEESLKGKTVVGLLRGDTSTRWFHDWVYGKAEVRFIKGRLNALGAGLRLTRGFSAFTTLMEWITSTRIRRTVGGIAHQTERNTSMSAAIVTGN